MRALSELDLDVSLGHGRAHLARYPRDDIAREAVGLLLFLLGWSRDIIDLYDLLVPQGGNPIGASPHRGASPS